MCGCIGCVGPADALQQHGGAKQNGITLSVEAPTLQAAAPAKAVNPLFEKRTKTFGELLPCRGIPQGLHTEFATCRAPRWAACEFRDGSPV